MAVSSSPALSHALPEGPREVDAQGEGRRVDARGGYRTGDDLFVYGAVVRLDNSTLYVQ